MSFEENIESLAAEDNNLQSLVDSLREVQSMQDFANKNNVSSEVMETLGRRQGELMNEMNKSLEVMSHQNDSINERDKELQERIERSRRQLKEIEYKKNLVATRDRMLQLSQEKNVYKLKVIYTLVAAMILMVILLLGGYVFFIKK